MKTPGAPLPGLREFVVEWLGTQPPEKVVGAFKIHGAAVAAGFAIDYFPCRRHLGLLVLDGTLEKAVGRGGGYRLAASRRPQPN